ncbi:MAG: tetratricopeptide repeat protein, partial [Deltaproteobacteria bacterium]
MSSAASRTSPSASSALAPGGGSGGIVNSSEIPVSSVRSLMARIVAARGAWYIAHVVSSRPARAALSAIVVLTLGGLTGCAHRQSERAMAAGVAAHQAGDGDRAKALYEEALDRDARIAGAANNLALLALEAGNERDAIALLARELGTHPTLPAARFNRALLFVRAGRHADAAADLEALA